MKHKKHFIGGSGVTWTECDRVASRKEYFIFAATDSEITCPKCLEAVAKKTKGEMCQNTEQQ